MGEKKVRAVAAGFSCMDVYEKINRCYPTGNGVDWGVHLQRLGISVSVVSVTGIKRMATIPQLKENSISP